MELQKISKKSRFLTFTKRLSTESVILWRPGKQYHFLQIFSLPFFQNPRMILVQCFYRIVAIAASTSAVLLKTQVAQFFCEGGLAVSKAEKGLRCFSNRTAELISNS